MIRSYCHHKNRPKKPQRMSDTDKRVMFLSIWEIIRDSLHGMYRPKVEHTHAKKTTNAKVIYFYVYCEWPKKYTPAAYFLVQYFCVWNICRSNDEQKKCSTTTTTRIKFAISVSIFLFLFLFIEFAVAHNCDQVKRLPLWLCPLT